MKNTDKKIFIALAITLVLSGVIYYFWLPPFNIHSAETWLFILMVLIIFLFTAAIAYTNKNGKIQNPRGRKVLKVTAGIMLVQVAAFLVLALIGTPIFRAKSFSTILTVEEGTVEQIPSVSGSDSIALMDTASAEKLGNREIGSLSEVVSQYDVSSYTQIDYQGSPVKVSPLRYAGFFKWQSNRENGVPGYVVVDPVSMSAEYTALSEGMKYVPSAYLNQDLYRHLRFTYPTEMIGNIHFEIDEEGNPWYVASTFEHQVGLFSGTQVNGAILVDPVTGESQKLSVDEVPTWVDVVFHGDLICEQYNNYAQLQKGFLNSIFSQSGSRKVTEATDEEDESFSDYGYIAKDGDIWIYTGVTSVNNDSSNIGFILANERTEQTIFIPAAGADEFSAMASAEGEVQEKGYQASFPSLILVDDTPTYIMVLKDDGGLVKMYATVNVEQYNMVATATTQEAVIEKYKALIHGEITQDQATDDVTEITVDESDFKEKTITIKKLQTIDQNGNTYLYVIDTENNIYSAKYTDVLDMLLVEEGDTITIHTDGTNFTYKNRS